MTSATSQSPAVEDGVTQSLRDTQTRWKNTNDSNISVKNITFPKMLLQHDMVTDPFSRALCKLLTTEQQGLKH